MPTPLHLLLLEDNAADAKLILHELRQADYVPVCRQVATEADFTAALTPALDVILADYGLPGWSGSEALRMVRRSGLDVPLIIVSGSIGEETAVAMMREGAVDYLIKDRLGRLGSAVAHAVAERDARRQRRQAEAALAESERFNRATLDALSAHVAVLDADGNILATNEAWRKFAAANGAPAGAVGEGTNYVTVCRKAAAVGSADAGHILAGIQAVIDGTQAVWAQEYPCHSDTERRWFYCTIRRFPGEGPVRVVVAHEDISEMKRAQESQHETAERLRLAVQASNIGLWDWDLRTNRVIYSREWKSQLGLEEQETGTGLDEWQSRVHPDDLPGALERVQRYLANPTSTHELEVRMRHKDGSWRWIYAHGEVFRDAGGVPVRMLGCHLDITARKEAEAALRREQILFTGLITTIPDHIYFKDRQSRFIRINEALARRFGLGHPDEAVGKTDWDMFSGPHARQSREDEQRIMETGEPMIAFEEKETWPDGRITWASTTKVPLRDAGGRITGLVGISRDITEKKLLEEKFLHAQRLESLGMLAAGIAHDLNNVLSPIMFASPVLRQNLTTERDLKILDTIAQSAARGAGLVKQILGFARSTAGDAQLTQVKHIVRDIMGVIEETFPKSIRLEQDIPSDLWPVIANATQIHQVLMNLCVNARDAMPDGGTLRLIAANRRLTSAEATVLVGARPGNWIMMEVTDTGTGIPPAVLEHIWEPFYTTKASGKGTGLGLSTVRGIVTNHLGFIELCTAPGKGTTFRINLPASEADAAGTRTTPPLEVKAVHNELILVVDDEEPIRDIVASILDSFGYRFLCCRDGAEALTLFNAHAGEIPLVITDLDMPELGGRALAAELRKVQPRIKIIAMSGLAQHAAHDMGAIDIRKTVNAFLLKPFKPEELLNAIHEVLHPVQQGQLQ